MENENVENIDQETIDTLVGLLNKLPKLDDDSDKEIYNALDKLHDDEEITDDEYNDLSIELHKSSELCNLLNSYRNEDGEIELDETKAEELLKDFSEGLNTLEQLSGMEEIIDKVTKYDGHLKDLQEIHNGLHNLYDSLKEMNLIEPDTSDDTSDTSDTSDSVDSGEGEPLDGDTTDANDDMTNENDLNGVTDVDESCTKTDKQLISEAIDHMISGAPEKTKEALSKVFKNKFTQYYDSAKVK